MKIIDIITEAPLPEDWDKEIYNSRISFAKRIEYAKARAAKLGSGSSRVAFVIPYQGRDTILKIAKNPKGMKQNEFEAEMLSDYYAKTLGLIPLIDYDEENTQPTWIHVEKAEKMTKSKFKEFFGADVLDVIGYINGHFNKGTYRPKPGVVDGENEHVMTLLDLVGNYGLPTGDFERMANWGIFKNQPVIIDVGLNTEIFNSEYRK